MRLPLTIDDYEGEFIIHDTRIVNGKKEEDREWIPRAVTNNDHRGYAVIIGNGLSREKFNLAHLARHRGGLFASMRCQTYGCNALYRDFSPDFLVAHNPAITKEVVESGYADNKIVYSSAQQLVKYPGKLYLIPQNINMNAGALATYLAAFDNHKNIYLLGFDNQLDPESNNNIYAGTENYNDEFTPDPDAKWINNMNRLFQAYTDVKFTFVNNNPAYVFPEKWNWSKNLKKLTIREFICEMDIG
tara:strand:- start:9659 stop:10393 length:735 start_codon:yes stop_codon:yes gene_type:complete